MGNWKELGVVPDSDDEGWDSEDSLQPLSLSHTLPKSQPDPRSDDVWEFRGSPATQSNASSTLQDVPLPPAQPQPSVLANCGEHNNHLPGEEQPGSSAVPNFKDHSDASHQYDDSPDSLRGFSAEAEATRTAGTTVRSPDPEDEICSSSVQINPSSANSLSHSPLEITGQDASVTVKQQLEENFHFGALVDTMTAGSPSPTAPATPVRGRRSLRPRKPIQQHPYLLENAQYSKAFKSHGLKPIRIAVAEQMAAKRRNEESQDHEFTGDEEDSGGPDEDSGGPDEESQTPLKKPTRIVLDDDLDELACSQSPRTSSPQRNLRASSEQSPAQQTDDSSIHDDEEFPDIRDLTAYKTASKSTKRRTPPQSSASRKRPRTMPAPPQHESPLRTGSNVWDSSLSPDPLSSTPERNNRYSPTESPRPSFRLRALSRSISPAGKLNPKPHPFTLAEPIDTEPIDLSALTEESEEEPNEPGGSSSDSESDIIRRTGRRIRGVLPASWLRLDQQSRKERTKTTVRKPSPPRSPDQPRPGLARTKLGLSKPTGHTKSFLDDLDQSDDGDQAKMRNNESRAHELGQERQLGNDDSFDQDDNASVVEDSLIDWMLPGQKRKSASSAGPPRKRKRTQNNISKGSKRYRQSKISGSVHRLDRHPDSTPRSHHRGRNGRQAKRAMSPPALSIVDVLEPGAPNFIRIAARAATKRKNMGRSKPLNKSINFGVRADNIDALSVLKRWQHGKIKHKAPKLAHPEKQQIPPRLEEFARPVASEFGRPSEPPAGLSFTQPQRMSRQISMDRILSTKATGVCSERQTVKKMSLRKTTVKPHQPGLGYRPGQLEADVLQGDDDIVFGARKKMLDLVFRKSRNKVLASTFQLRQSPPIPPSEGYQLGPSKALPYHALAASQLDQQGDSSTTRKPRSRKLHPPKRLDLDAPQYKCANEPLPFLNEDSMSVDEDVQSQRHEGGKIIGLGPFGTHYTQHFDIFPLHSDTFFHHTTLIGDGTLKKALGYRPPHSVTCDSPALIFEFSNHRFQWKRWTETTSSELGLLFDLIVEHVEDNGDKEAPFGVHQAANAADNILKYVLHFASVNEESELSFFTQRMLKLLVGFIDLALESTYGQRTSRVLLDVTARFLICALVLLRLCQGTLELSDQALQAEDILKRLAKALIEKLVSIGFSGIRTTYDDLQRVGVRECGIRADNFMMISWVIVIKVLEKAQMPRGGFWDLASSAIATNLTNIIDAHILEDLWRDLFTLLPLTEFDDAGVVSKGLRYVAPLQGWILPQKLLKVVFESYQVDQRQSPSFNDYCRALLGRCHHLIKQWGWQRCIGIIGTIFDFFGRQNLSHLRNEEVFKSPRFLEELSDGPVLSVEPEDRCFHIFLKILAVAIQSMKRRGLSNDIRNLITRCLPNHNRQFSKEQTVHFDDLASLRNHHDLLCTLYWAAPPESRRPVALIEDLVQPASSHKEACLINLRAWSQLARFIVSSGSSIQDYRPFLSWQNNVFQQVLNQYLSIAADVEHQFMSMAKEDRSKIQKQFLERVVTANQNAAKDVLYFSVMASLDVMKHCPSLTAATFSFNVSQVTKTFNKLSSKGTDLDWGILRASFDTVDVFVGQLESLCCSLRESTGDSAPTHSSRELEDAVEFLDEKMIQSFIIAVRKAMISLACDTASQSAGSIVKKAIILCGRVASFFIEGGKSSLLHFFTTGKYGLFEAHPDRLGLLEWKFVPLFVATLLKNHMFNFSSLGCTHFDIWISSLVKPVHASQYLAELAETLQALDMGYMTGTRPMTRTVLDYSKKRDLFAGCLSYMRKEVRQADFAQRRPMRAKYERTLKSVMCQIKSDIGALKSNSMEHSNFISFIRDVIGLIKSHGADICSIDPFFYQVSAEYSPPKEDPQLHTAGILAYGIRLGEGDTTAIPQLFSYLYNHFKMSLASNRLEAESKIIEDSMKDDKVLSFVIGSMLPAIIQASSHSNDIWPLLGVYTKALHDVLTRSCLPREIPEDAVDEVIALLTAVLNWTQSLGESSTYLTPTQAHILTQLVGICNVIYPLLSCWLLRISAKTSRLRGCIGGITRIAKQAAAVLDELQVSAGCETTFCNVSVKDLILVDSLPAPTSFNSHVNAFTQNLVCEVRSNWVITSDFVTVRIAAVSSTQQGTQAAQGVKNDLRHRPGLLLALLSSLRVWISEMGEEEEKKKNSQHARRRRPRHFPRY